MVTKFNIKSVKVVENRNELFLSRYLASGDSIVSIAFLFRIGVSTASMVIQETCSGLWKCLQKSELPVRILAVK